jgi:hypothetical protein
MPHDRWQSAILPDGSMIWNLGMREFGAQRRIMDNVGAQRRIMDLSASNAESWTLRRSMPHQ